MVFLEVPDQPGTTLELLLTDSAGELWRVALQTPDEVVLHSVHSGALETAVLHNRERDQMGRGVIGERIRWGGV